MATRVISDKPDGEIRKKCPKCFHVIGYTPLDVKHGTYSTMGESNDWYYVVCPKCEHRIEVPEKHYVG